MKYSKDVIVAAIKNRLERIEKSEEESYQRALEYYRRRLEMTAALRRDISRAIVDIGNLEPTDFAGFRDILNTIGEISDGRSSNGRFFAERLNQAVNDLVEPVKNTSESDALKVTLEIFETGAPPEVSIQDLRGFGLLQIIKYGK